MEYPALPLRRSLRLLPLLALALAPALPRLAGQDPNAGAVILTPPPPPTPRINGPAVFGVRPGSPFLYRIPATGERPMTFAVDGLPAGLRLDPATGQIAGRIAQAGTYAVVLRAANALGTDRKPFRIVAGEAIALTPAMGWNSWNCWAGSVDQDKILRSARAMVRTGLSEHGWTYVNIDDTWQGRRTGPGGALQGNAKFPDMKALCDAIHALGLKAGIYSTPWITSYAGYPGGSSDQADGAWTKALAGEAGHRFGRHSFARADADQWAAWGFDYLKYDWNPIDVPHVAEMSRALRRSGRDIVFSLSNAAPFAHVADWARLANSWRTTSDIWDRWAMQGPFWQYGVSEIGFNQDRWAPWAGPGHWNDPDMLVLGEVGWGHLHPTRLTPDEQLSHFSLWCMLSAPLLIGCDLDRLDRFTLSLLTNDEVIAVDQDPLGAQAVRVATWGPVDIYLKPMADGSKVIGFFNRDSARQAIVFNKLFFAGITSRQHVRDLWRQRNLPDILDPIRQPLELDLPAHGAALYRLTPAS
jgi:alpha-galactosidase